MAENDSSVLKLMSEASGLIERFRPYGYGFGGIGFEHIDRALKYPDTSQLTYYDFQDRYLRQDIAYRIVKAPVGVTWKEDPEIFSVGGDSSFNEDMKELVERVDLYKNMATVDLLARMGKFSLLFLGFSDSNALETEVQRGATLVYVKPLAEPVVKVAQTEMNPMSPRFGAPVVYTITIENGSASTTRYVHYTRVIHVAENTLDDPYVGVPALLPIYNRLLGLEKIAGGSPEMYWRGARPGYAASSSGGVMATNEQIEQFKETISDFVNNMNRWLYSEDLKIQSLAPQVVSPKEHFEVQMQLISAATRIPLRILTGSERGELASDQDERGWLSYIEERRDEIGKKVLLRPLIDTLIKYNIVGAPVDNYSIYWKPLVVISEKDKAEIADVLSAAIKKYDDSATAKDMVPPEIYTKYVLRFDDTILEEIEKINEATLGEEDSLTQESIIDQEKVVDETIA